jgi:hypothetical protein
MCEKCKELDEKIARYGRLSASITDQPTVERFMALIVAFEARKSDFHPEQEKK